MNEQKKMYDDFINPNISEQKQSATDLAAQISYFMSHTTLKAGDWVFLDRMLKQLNKQKFNLSRKVLRSMQTKFENLKKNYQR